MERPVSSSATLAEHRATDARSTITSWNLTIPNTKHRPRRISSTTRIRPISARRISNWALPAHRDASAMRRRLVSMDATSCAVGEATKLRLKKWLNDALVLSTGVVRSSAKSAGQRRPFIPVYKPRIPILNSLPTQLINIHILYIIYTRAYSTTHPSILFVFFFFQLTCY